MDKAGFRKDYYLKYALLFTLICLIAFSYYYVNGRTFINHTNDGLIQHYKALAYYSQYLKTFFKNLFINHQFIIPQWDFSIGEGADILQTLHMYAIGDPLAFFSVFFPLDKIYVYYDASIIIRLFLSGIVFSELCFYTKQKNKYAVLAGTVTYVFCFWNLLNVNEHIYFLNPMIYLPLILLGVEKTINGDKPYLLTVSVFISALSNFYFFYMLVLLTAIYTLVRLIIRNGKDFKMILTDIIKIALFSFVGVLMASVILLPVITAFASDSRASLDSGLGLFYSFFYYERLFTIFVSNDYQYDLCMGFASPTILALGLLLKDKDKKGRLLLSLCFIALVMICLPMAGNIMNGFAYPINRWSFAIALLVTYSLVYKWEEIQTNGKYLYIFMAIVFVLAMVSAWSRQLRVLIPVVLCVVFCILANTDRIKNNLKQCLLLLIIVVNVLYIADYDYSSRGSHRLEDGATVEEAVAAVTNADSDRYKRNNDFDSFYRYSGNHLDINSAIISKTYSTDFYWSLTNPHVISFREKLGLLDFTSYMYRGYDDRSGLYSLANVRDFLGYGDLVPYGFSEEKNYEGTVQYRNDYYLPFGYTYDKTLSYDVWDKLDQIQKQEVLLDSIILEDGDSKEIKLTDNRLDFTFAHDDTIEIGNNCIKVNQEKAELKILITDKKTGEYYLSFSGLNFEDSEGYIEGNRTWVKIKTLADNIKKDLYYFTPEYQFYCGRHDFSICYGYREDGLNEITITFPYPGIYSYEDLYITCLGYDNYRNETDKLKESVLTDVEFGNNSISGSIDLDEDKYLLLSIPYSKGWKAYVDGKKVELLRCNECYMALKLDRGHHSIEMKYETPLLKAGTVLSVLSTLMFVIYIHRERKNK